MSAIIFNADNFRILYEAFRNPAKYPDATLIATFNDATCYVSDRNGGCYTQGMSLKQQTQALNLMTAHLLALDTLIASGETSGVMSAATIDKVTVTLQPPPVKDQWQYWLNTTPYGQRLLALLSAVSVGGFYFAGAPGARSGFRW